MTEIQRITKVSLLVYGIVCILFGFMMIFLLDDIMTPVTDWTNPLHPRMFGGVLLVIAVFNFLIFLNKGWEWEQVKLAYVLLYSLILVTILAEVSVTALYFSTFSAAMVSEMIFELIVMSALLIFGVYSYTKQSG